MSDASTHWAPDEGVAILGGGGFAREAYWYLRDAGLVHIAFVDDTTERTSLRMAGCDVPVVRDWDFAALPFPVRRYVVGVGAPHVKRVLIERAAAAGLAPGPTVCARGGQAFGRDNVVGPGGVICPGTYVTTHVTLGAHVILNLGVTVGHDAVIGDRCTLNPGAHVSGNVRLGADVLVGTGAAFREGVTVADGVVIGAQACIVKDVLEPGIVVGGVPARPLPPRP